MSGIYYILTSFCVFKSVVIGCSEQVVENAEEALGWLGVGNAARITGATQMNQRSSRSHAVFTIHISRSHDVLSHVFHMVIAILWHAVTSSHAHAYICMIHAVMFMHMHAHMLSHARVSACTSA